MKAVDTKREALAATGLLAEVRDRDIDEIARLCDVVHVDAGMRLAMQDTLGQECFVIATGTASVAVNGDVIATVRSGDVAGEVSLLDHGLRTATVVATSPMTLLVFARREFRTVMATYPQVARRVAIGLGARLRQADARVAEVHQ